MNRRQKIVQQQFLNNEKVIINRLDQVYSKSLQDINGKIANLDTSISKLQDAFDSVGDKEVGELAKAFLESKKVYTPQEARETLQSMLQSKVYQKKYQEALKRQVDGVLNTMQKEQFGAVSDYLDKCYEDGFVGAIYDLQGQGIPLAFPLDQEAMVRAVQLDSKISEGLYTRLGEDVALLKKKITAQVSRGIATGMAYKQVAQQLEGVSRIGYNNAVRIARTEGHRIQCQSTMDAAYKAKEKGANVVKQWDAALDARTRDSHAKVDGEIRELDKAFSNGLMFPGDPSGAAGEVINCRCALLQRAKWALDEKIDPETGETMYTDSEFTKMNNFTKQIETFDSPESYADFKKAFFSKENRNYMNYVQQMEEKYKTKDFAKILDGMNTREYNHYSKLLGGNPLYDKNILTNSSKSGIMSSKTDGFKKIKGEHSISDDIGTPDAPICNPKLKTGGIGYQMNCAYCSATYEMRRRGYDVIANPLNTMLVTDWQRLFKDCKPIKLSSNRTAALATELQEKLSAFGNGARGSLFVSWKTQELGHFFSWEVENGKVRFIDGQMGETDVSRYLGMIKPTKTICLRWDDREPSDMIKDACKNRGGD